MYKSLTFEAPEAVMFFGDAGLLVKSIGVGAFSNMLL